MAPNNCTLLIALTAVVTVHNGKNAQ